MNLLEKLENKQALGTECADCQDKRSSGWWYWFFKVLPKHLPRKHKAGTKSMNKSLLGKGGIKILQEEGEKYVKPRGKCKQDITSSKVSSPVMF